MIDNILSRNRVNLLSDTDIKVDEFEKKVAATYGRTVNLTRDLISQIDYNDKEFINRIYDDITELKNDEFVELKKSIEEIGLMNNVYLILRDDKKYKIVSGLRRLLSCKALYDENKIINGRDRVVILNQDTPLEILEKFSIHENTHRKNLKVLELSYKLNRESLRQGKDIKNILEEYGISKGHYHRIKNVMNYPDELKKDLEAIGIGKAEILNKIISELSSENVGDVISKYKELTRDDLMRELQNIKKKKKDKNVKTITKYNKNSYYIKFDSKVPDEVKDKLKTVFEKIKNNDYNF